MGNNQTDQPLTAEEFKAIYSKVSRLCVEIVIKTEQGVLLSLRDIEPYKGKWHFPGGTVLYGEKVTDAVRRVAAREIGVQVTGEPKLLGWIDYPSYYEHGFGSPVGLAFLVDYEGKITPNEEAARMEWFTEIPADMHADQDVFISKYVLPQI